MPQRKHAAIMFTDIVGYTALMGKDENRALSVLQKNREIHKRLIKKYLGELIKEMGDGLLISFPLASDAVRCAQEIQHVIKNENITLRIGIHEGEVLFEGRDVLGDGVNIASRLQEFTDPGCIVVSGAVYTNIKNKPEIEVEFVKETTFKNVDEPVKVYKVSCEKQPVKESTSDSLEADIKDIIRIDPVETSEKIDSSLPQAKKRLKITYVFIVALAVLVVAFVYPKVFRKDKFEGLKDTDGRISIAVMPFENLSGDTLYNVWQGGFQNLLISTLSNSKELTVRQYQTMHEVFEGKRNLTYASITPTIASELAQKLETKTFILGNILKAGNKIRINTQLINAETEEIYKTYQIDGNSEDDIFAISDSLSGLIKNYLEIKKLIEEYDSPVIRESIFTNSSRAFQYYIHGYDAFMNLDFQAGSEWLTKAIEVDSGFVGAYIMLSFNYLVTGKDQQAKNCCIIAMKRRHELPLRGKLMLDHLNSYYFETPYEEIRYIKQILEIDKMNTTYWYLLGSAYYKMEKYREAINYWEKTLNIHKKWGTNYRNPFIYDWLGDSYHQINEHKREEEVYKFALNAFPDLPNIRYRQAICALAKGSMEEADVLINKYKSIRKNRSQWSDSHILSSVGYIYSNAYLFEDAEKYLRQALKMEPDNPDRINTLAWFLIDKDINVDEGVDLIQKALVMEPDTWRFIDTKGWGLYKQGKYEEALKILKDAWDLRPMYRHRGYLNILEVEEAVAKQNK